MAKDETEFSLVRELSAAEYDVIASLNRAWNGFVKMTVIRGAHQDEFAQAIHAAQRIVLVRPILEREDERYDSD